MKEALEILNTLKDTSLINDYAIGGGIATIFYTEPVFTYDLDIFVVVKSEPDAKIISLAPIYDYFASKGYSWKGEHIIIEGLPVQFIPVESGIEREALENSKDVIYGGVKTKILSAEYLIAIALKAGRRKDFDKVGRLVEQAKINKRALEAILKKHHLLDKFRKWQEELR
jgi:predicted nucleotidyltransferase